MLWRQLQRAMKNGLGSLALFSLRLSAAIIFHIHIEYWRVGAGAEFLRGDYRAEEAFWLKSGLLGKSNAPRCQICAA